jgi:Acetyltransferase (GNAT) family
MAALDNVNGVEFTHYDTPGSHLIRATRNEQAVGHLYWNREEPGTGTNRGNDEHGPYAVGEIETIHVNAKDQHKGIATHMYDHAKAIGAQWGEPPHHSANRSKQGDAWARTTGDHVPKLKES